MMSDIEIIQELFGTQPKELSFLYKMDLIQQEKKYQYNWDRESMYKLKNSFPEILLLQNERNNVNYLTVTGPVGRGKSNNSLWIAQYCDPLFNLKTHLYLGKDTDLSLDYIVEEHSKGDYIVIEEAEIMLSKYTSNSLQNRAVRDTLDTVRDFGVNFIFNAPAISSLDREFVNYQVNWNIICSFNNEKQKYTNAFLEVNVSDERNEKFGYVDHSKLIFPYVKKPFFNRYVKIKRDKLYNPHKYRRSFHDSYKSRVKTEDQNLVADKLIKFRELVNKTKLKKKRDAKRKQQIALAVKGLEIGLSKSRIMGILQISDGKINDAESIHLMNLRKETIKRRRVGHE